VLSRFAFRRRVKQGETSMNLDPQLKLFLDLCGITELFENRLEEEIHRRIPTISCAFIWETTPEGFYFWRDLNDLQRDMKDRGVLG
jgi:hypothetical protein